MEEPGRLQSMGSLRVGHDWATSLWLFTFVHWRRKWQPTPVFLPGESQGRGSWRAAVYGVEQSRTRLKWLSSSSKCITWERSAKVSTAHFMSELGQAATLTLHVWRLTASVRFMSELPGEDILRRLDDDCAENSDSWHSPRLSFLARYTKQNKNKTQVQIFSYTISFENYTHHHNFMM